jgi:hypothetical protein
MNETTYILLLSWEAWEPLILGFLCMFCAPSVAATPILSEVTIYSLEVGIHQTSHQYEQHI